MKIELLLHTLTTNSKPRKCKIKVQIGEVNFQSTEQVPVNGTFPFLQKNMLEVDESKLQYIYFQLVSEKKRIANKTLFVEEAMNKKSINLNSFQGKQTFKLNFSLQITSIDIEEQSQFIPFKRTTSIEDQPAHLSEGEGKLKVLKLGVLGYNFAQRLDPAVHFQKKIISIIEWDKPQQTIGIACFLSFMVLFPKISISILSLALLFGKQKIYRKLQEYQSGEDPSKRVLLPEQNMIYLQDSMQSYCDYFDYVNKFIRQDDKTMIIKLVQILCKFGVLLLILQLFFTIQNLILITIWLIFLLLSPMRKKVFKFAKPKILQINNLIDIGIQKISKSPVGFIFRVDPKQVAITKQLYIFQYHRWWLGKQWVSTHWSDENREIHLLATKQAPKGWQWLQNWKFQISDNTDEHGFEYTTDLSYNYSPSSTLKTIRRRKWTRQCLRTKVITPPSSSIKLQENKSNQLLMVPSFSNEGASNSSQILQEIGPSKRKNQ